MNVSGTTSGKVSPAFALAAACCRWPPSPAREHAVASAAKDIDWARLIAIGKRQRVCALIADGLRRAGIAAPTPFAALLAAEASGTAQENLKLAAETLRLDRALTVEGERPLMVKGASLAMLAYGTLAVKQSIDIDLLVAPERLEAAAAALAELGYVRIRPAPELGAAQFRAWLATAKESAWVHHERGVMVELHARLLETAALLPGVGVASPRQAVALASGATVETLNGPDLYAYLTAHGAWHGWARLKWLADISALVTRAPEGVEALHGHAVALGVGRCSAQALLLGERLLGLNLPAALSRTLKRSAVNRWLAKVGLASMAGDYESAEHRHALWLPAPVIASHFLLRRGLRYKLAEMGQKLSNPEDRARDGDRRGSALSYVARGGIRAGRRLFGLTHSPRDWA
ncbi:nucleotidyltransferase family protein [Sphingomonas sp. LT1P40]|uniref:nucleotidyltransferase family protein n=1 Tax=Alteristakelama amylovorans TaxID=3096166 RepID=UPI002FC6CCC1